ERRWRRQKGLGCVSRDLPRVPLRDNGHAFLGSPGLELLALSRLDTAAIGRAPRQYAVGLVTGLPENKFTPRSNGAHSLCQCLGGGKVGFSIAARVKRVQITSCRHPFALRLLMAHGALASLRGRRQAAS